MPSRLATDQRSNKSLLDDLTRPLDQVADNEGRGLDLVYQPDTLAHQEIHGLDIPGSRSVWWEPHKPEHRDSLARDRGGAHHRLIWPGRIPPRFLSQPRLYKRCPQGPVRGVRPAVPKERRTHGIGLGGRHELLLVQQMPIGF